MGVWHWIKHFDLFRGAVHPEDPCTSEGGTPETLRQRIQRHEDLSLTPYLDTKGRLTVGYGHRLDQPITTLRAESYLTDDLEDAEAGVRSLKLPSLDTVRHDVLVEMVFQLGADGVLGFDRFITAVKSSDWDGAANEMLDSLWARETPARAKELADLMRRA